MSGFLPFLFPTLILLLSGWNFYEETLVRYLHKKGVQGTGTVAGVRKTIVKDRRSRMFGGGRSDMSDTCDVRCDYIMSIDYNDGTRDRHCRDIVVTDDIRVSGKLLYSAFREGDEVPIRFKPGIARCVVDHPKSEEYECNKVKYALWAFCLFVAILLMIGMFLSNAS